jgi:DNA-binding response OmpR family regulator
VRIGLLEDDVHQAHAMQVWLEAAGHECRVFPSGTAFREAVREAHFDLLILDWLLPDTNGIEILQWLRSQCDWQVPVIFVTRMDKEEDVVLALGQGADDYMTKPVKPLEMLARITALSRRAHPQQERPADLTIGPYRFNINSRTLEHAGERVDLTHKEFDLALFLFRNPGRLLSRGKILETVWGTTAELNTRTVDTHISRIRNKLGLLPENGWRLSAVYQHGYRLERLDKASDEQSQA